MGQFVGTRRMALGMAAIAAFVAASPAAARPSACVPGTPAVAHAEFDRFNTAWKTQDPDKVTELFSDDALLLPTLSPVPRTDHAGIRDYFVGFLKGGPQAELGKVKRVYGGCNWVLHAGQWTITKKGQPDVHARFTFLYRHAHGKWWIVHLHSSVDPDEH